MDKTTYRSQVLVLGSGLSGCITALTVADEGFEVVLISPTDDLNAGNSDLAQGGIVYVYNNEQDEIALTNDMLIAGHHYNSTDAIEFLAKKGGEAVQKILIDRLQVPFNLKTAGTEDWDLTLEGGHSIPRILHCADYTGSAIMEKLHNAIRSHPNIKIHTNRIGVDLITADHHTTLARYRYNLKNQCMGAYIFNEITLQVEKHLADITILATGGVGGVFLHSTNSTWAVGSGICMADRAGARLANMEFVQFHPTALYDIDKSRPLITEAVRGEGGILVDHNGVPFMHKYDERKDLAPRDIVSQSIATEMLQTGVEHLYLDARHLDCDVTKRFPTVYKNCLKLGIDIRKDLIPIVPAAHYFCGGILVDSAGQTTLDNLYAVGECSCTGIHGANRLASTSLLEAVLWGYSAGENVIEKLNPTTRFDETTQVTSTYVDEELFNSIPNWRDTGNEHNDDPALIAQDWTSIRTIMWNYVGIMRTESRLRRAFADLRDLSSHLHDFYRHTSLSKDLIRLFHGCQTAYLITQAALRNKQSKGCHHRAD